MKNRSRKIFFLLLFLAIPIYCTILNLFMQRRERLIYRQDRLTFGLAWQVTGLRKISQCKYVIDGNGYHIFYEVLKGSIVCRSAFGSISGKPSLHTARRSIRSTRWFIILPGRPEFALRLLVLIFNFFIAPRSLGFLVGCCARAHDQGQDKKCAQSELHSNPCNHLHEACRKRQQTVVGEESEFPCFIF